MLAWKIVLIGVVGAATADPKPVKGPYGSKQVVYTNKKMDSTDQQIDVFYPDHVGMFPVIAYAHGDDAADPGVHYKPLFEGLNSFGYIVIAHRACNTGCKDDKSGLPGDPGGFAHYYKQQLLAIEWAQAAAVAGTDPVLKNIDLSNGVGIAGHSMGGQSTVFASSYGNASAYNITAAVMHHAYTHSYPAPQIPFLATTGSADLIASRKMTENYYNAVGASATKGYVNKRGADHSEPDVEAYNPLLAQFTAAWFKLHLEKKPKEFGLDFEEMIYGNSTKSICNGGDGKMVRCEMHR